MFVNYGIFSYANINVGGLTTIGPATICFFNTAGLNMGQFDKFQNMCIITLKQRFSRTEARDVVTI